MDVAELRTFETVARLGGMNRAALELNTVQSNITARIRALESELGCPLFERHSRGVTLTGAGQRLLPYAHEIAQLIAEAARVARDDGEPQGALIVGSLETTAALHLSPLLSAFVATYPDVDLVLRTGTTQELVEAVLERRVEGAFVCGPVRHSEIVAEEMFREELVLLAAPKISSVRALLREGEIRIVVLKAGCSYRQRLEALLAKRGILSPRLLEFGTLEAIFKCVGAGLGITLLPRRVIERVWEAGEVSAHALPKSEAEVDTHFIRRRDVVVSTALTRFVERARSPSCRGGCRPSRETAWQSSKAETSADCAAG